MLAILTLLACQDQGVTAHNEAPIAEITSPVEGASVVEDIAFDLVGVVSDADDSVDSLTVVWMLGAEELCPAGPPDATGFSLCSTALPRGEHEVSLVVLDPTDASGTDTVVIDSQANEAPVVTLTAPETSGTYYADLAVPLEATVVDDLDSGELLTAVWLDGGEDMGLNPTVSEDGETATSVYLTEGPHTLTLEATDTTGKTGSATVSVLVGAPNSTPDCTITAPADGIAYNEGETVTFEGTATDVDVDAEHLTATWTSDVEGELGSGPPTSDGATTAVSSTLSQATHIVTLEVTDEVGATCTDTVVVTIGTPPTLTVTSPTDGDVVDDGDRVTFAATVSDGEDPAQVLVFSWSSDLDGEFSTQGADASGAVSFTTGTLSVGSHTISVRATDTDGFYAQVDLALRVNGLPGAPTISLSPDPASTTDDLVVSIDSDSVDPDGDAITYTYAWTRNGVASSASASATLPASNTAKGETWAVTVTPSDGLATGTSASDSVTIANTAPTVASATLSPDPAVTGDTLTCTAGATADDDGDGVSLRYTWTVDGSTSAGSNTLASASTVKGQSITCSVTPSDGTDSGTAANSNTVVIGNTAPEVTGVSLVPSTVYTDDTVSAVVTSSDDDGDTVSLSYAWAVNGSTIGATSSSLDGTTWFDKGDTLAVTVTPSDGSDSGSAVTSSTVTVLNSAPEAPVISIDPAAPYHGRDDLQCSLDTPSSDADGDSIIYSLSWTRDGIPYTSATSTVLTGDTVSGADTSPGEVWTCTLTPSDAWDTGTSATASVTIGCLDGSDASCPSTDCDTILADGGSLGDGTYWIDPVGAGGYEVWCDMTTDGGGWTLAAVSSDDGDDTWTWDERALWDTDTSTFGDLANSHEDMKSLSLNEVSFSDVLFLHHPSGDWASYDGVGDGSSDLGTYIGGVGEAVCWDAKTDGIPMSAGTISVTGDLCSTDLFFNAADADGQSHCSCTNCANTHGPAWSVGDNSGCPLDDPGRRGSLGPSEKTPTTEQTPVGFGWALGLNTGASGAAENYIWMLVR